MIAMTRIHAAPLAVLSDKPGYGPATRISWLWLSVPAVTGLVLILIHVHWEAGPGRHPWSSVFVNAGTALLLFAVLLVFQRSLVERAVNETVRRLTREELESKWAETTDNPLTPGDFHDDLGPAVASAFVRDCSSGDYRDALLLADPDWRLSRAQAWIFNNLASLGLQGTPHDAWDDLARCLATGPHEANSQWEEFLSTETAQFREVFSDFDDDRWGWSQRRRIIGPRHEVVVALPLPQDAPDGFVLNAPLVVPRSIQVLLRCLELEGKRMYLVAGVNVDAPPLPGWPPSWWIIDDPVAAAHHPGVATRT